MQKAADKLINKETPGIRYRNIYLEEYEEGDWKNCNIEEIRLLKKRKALQTWIHENDLIKQLLMEQA